MSIHGPLGLGHSDEFSIFHCIEVKLDFWNYLSLKLLMPFLSGRLLSAQSAFKNFPKTVPLILYSMPEVEFLGYLFYFRFYTPMKHEQSKFASVKYKYLLIFFPQTNLVNFRICFYVFFRSYRSRQYYQSKILHDTEVSLFSTTNGSLNKAPFW